jgi:HD-like signal output (HDOD) protein
MQLEGMNGMMSATTLTLEDIVAKTSDLPSLPAAALAVMRETDSPTGTAQSIARYLSQDQALTARILRLANSAYYGLARQIMDVSDAVVVLGMRCIRNLCMVASTYPWMTKPLKGYGLGPREMWTHSFAVAVGSQLVATRSRSSISDQAFTAGLLHNLGKVALSIWLEDKLAGMLAIACREGITFDQVERKVLGFDHCDVGAHMGEVWNLPKPLIDAMRYHHNPNACDPHNPLVDCVHVADYLTMSMGLGLGGDGLRYDFQEEALLRLNLTPEMFDELAEEFLVSYEQHEKLFEDAS